MTYTPTGYSAVTLGLAVTELSTMSAWQTLCVVGTAPLALQHIVIGQGGTAHAGKFVAADASTQTLAAPLAEFALGQPSSSPNGLKRWARRGSVVIDLVIPPLAGGTPPEVYQHACDQVAAIHRGFEAAHEANRLIVASIEVTGPPFLADPAGGCPSWMAGCHLAQITLTYAIGV